VEGHNLPEKLFFVLPNDKQAPSGGNIYNARLIKALRQIGQPVTELSYTEYQSALSSNEPGIYGVDSLFVEKLKSLSTLKGRSQHNFFILHHLESLHPSAGNVAEELFREEKKVLERFDSILVSSGFASDYLRQQGMTMPIMTVEPALDRIIWHPPLPTPAPLRAIMVANLVERKGVYDFLKNLLEQGSPRDAFELTIVGRTDIEPLYAKSCQHLVQGSFLRHHVTFKGPLTHQQTLAEYGKHHLLVSAAAMETFGMAIQEARAAGLPVLVREGGYSAQHIQEGSGKLCRNTVELAENFLHFCRNEHALKAFSAAALRARAEYAAYTWEQAATLFIQEFRHFL